MSAPATDQLKRRGWWSFIAYLLTLAGSALLFVAATTWFVHAHRTEIVTRTVADYVAPYQLTLGSIDIDRSGKIYLDSISLTDPADENTRFELGHANWDWDTRSLIAARYGAFDLEAPTVRIGPKTFAAWMEPAVPTPNPEPEISPPPKPLIETLALSLQKIGIRAGKFEFQAESYPAVTFDFEYFGDEIGFDSGRLSSDPQKLQIRNFEAVFTASDSAPTTIRFSRLDLEFHAVRDPSLLDVSIADFSDLEVKITPAIRTYASLWSAPPSDPLSPPSHPIFAQLIIDSLKLPNVHLSISGFDKATPSLPDLEYNTDFSVQILAADLERGTFSIGRQTIVSRDFDLRFPSSPGHIQFQNLTASASNITSTGAIVDSLTLAGTDINLTETFLSRLTSASPEDASTETASSESSPPATAVPDITFKKIEIPDAQITASLPDIPEVTFTLSTSLAGWTLAEADDSPIAFHLPDSPQSLLISDLRIGSRDSPIPLAQIDLAALLINPATFARTRQIDSIQIISPHFHLTPENFPQLPASTSEPTEPPVQIPEPAALPLWHGITITDLAIEDGTFDIEERTLHGVPAVHFEFAAATSTTGEIPTYTIPLTGITSTIESFQKAPFQTTRALTFTLDTEDLWKNHTFTEVDFDGMSGVMAQDLLDAMGAMIDAPETAAPPSPIPPPDVPDSDDPKPDAQNPESELDEVPPHKKPWKIGRLRVRNSTITLRGVAPGLPPVTVGIKADLEGVPISPEAFLGDLREHRVEIDKIKIPSYYNTLVNVAVLENIWVDFTLDGIAQQRIDNVIIGSPTVFVGEHLFWYIDYYRKFLDDPAAGEATPEPSPPPTEVQSDAKEDPSPPEVADPEDDPKAEPKIKDPKPEIQGEAGSSPVTRLQALNGKLIVAPKGTPVPGFPYPFPFSADTTLESGELHSEFTVTNGTYELEDIKLELTDLHGGVEFNLPFKKVNNNLTETLVAKHMRFHQMESEEPWVTVTYDTYGIYAKFGAEMYGGYIKGAFNIYLDDQYTWDSWVTGTAIGTEPLTSALTPEYFKMDGPIDFTVIATGNASELYQADGTLESKEPGKMTIEALNDAISAIPGDWIHLEKRITEIGLETLRDFDYDSVTGSFRLFGREGKVNLNLQGPHGSRVFKVKIHDHRRPALDSSLLDVKKPAAKPRQAQDAPASPAPANP